MRNLSFIPLDTQYFHTHWAWERCSDVVLTNSKSTHPFHCQCSNPQQSRTSNSQNQPGIRQQKVNHYSDAFLSSPPTALEVHLLPCVVSLWKRRRHAFGRAEGNTRYDWLSEGKQHLRVSLRLEIIVCNSTLKCWSLNNSWKWNSVHSNISI